MNLDLAITRALTCGPLTGVKERVVLEVRAVLSDKFRQWIKEHPDAERELASLYYELTKDLPRSQS